VTEAIIEGLRTVPIFATLDDDAIARAAAIAGIDDHAKGSVLIERGLPGAGLFVILDGTVAVELQHRTVELGPG
jgi:CRP-like cAMP-binding protein